VFAAFPLVFAVASGTADRAALLRPSLVQDALRVQGVLAGLLLLVPSVLMTYVLLVERGGHFEVRADLAGLVSSLAARAGSQQALESVIVRAPLALTVIVATASLCVTVRRGFPTTRVSK
jgi:hypothetical protein